MDLKSVRISLNIMDFGKYVENCRLREMLLSVLFALAGVPVGMAQMQVVAKLEGVMGMISAELVAGTDKRDSVG
ncbi:MAG: hypothetical protein ABSF76_10300 [Opitutaceae bacterium]